MIFIANLLLEFWKTFKQKLLYFKIKDIQNSIFKCSLKPTHFQFNNKDDYETYILVHLLLWGRHWRWLPFLFIYSPEPFFISQDDACVWHLVLAVRDKVAQTHYYFLVIHDDRLRFLRSTFRAPRPNLQKKLNEKSSKFESGRQK